MAKAGQKPGFHHTEETKQKLSALRRGEKNPFFGRKHSDEFKARLAERTKLLNAKRQYEIQPRSIRELSDTDAAYLAGMIDGDGVISKVSGRKSVQVIVTNTIRSLMDWLETLVPYKSYCRRVTINQNAKVQPREPIWIWTLYSAQDVAYTLRRIRPYLRVKGDRCDDALEFLTHKYGERLNG